MVQLLYSRYVPIETAVVSRKDGKTKEEYEILGYKVKELPGDFYNLTKQPKLEMVFRDGKKDYVFDMYDEFEKYYKLYNIENVALTTHLAGVFVHRIAIGKTQISISSDETYTLNEV